MLKANPSGEDDSVMTEPSVITTQKTVTTTTTTTTTASWSQASASQAQHDGLAV